MGLPAREPSSKGSPWTFRLTTLWGIPVRVHLTFVLFLAWLGVVGGLGGFLFVVGLFACVVLHEYGHALTARRYGIATRDITLYPMGGVAMLSGRLVPRHELWVALAGPLVNVVVAAFLWIGTHVGGGSPGRDALLGELVAANLAMAAFNMIPAFPMDGGRVFRAILSRAMPPARATAVAAIVGQALAVALFAFAIVRGPAILALVAAFVFLGADQERRAESVRSFLLGHRLREAMRTTFRTMPHGASLGSAARMLLGDSQADFPVVANGEVVGLVTRRDIAQGIVEDGPGAYVAGHMRREHKVAPPDAPLEDAVEMLTREDPSPILVMEEGQLLGMVSTDDVGEFLTHERARARLL